MAPRLVERGNALLTSVLLTLVLGGMSVLCLSGLPRSLRGVEERVSRTQARYRALGACARSRDNLAKGGTGDIEGDFVLGGESEAGDPALPATPDAYAVDAEWVGNDLYVLTATARWHGAVETLTQVVERQGRGMPSAAVFGAASVDLDDIFTDSFDSAASSYASAPKVSQAGTTRVNTGGTIASNGSIVLDDDWLFGDARPGPGGTLTHDHLYITGSTSPAASPVNLSPVPFSPPMTNDNTLLGAMLAGSSAVADDGTYNVPGGVYVIDSLQASDDAVVEIAGDAVFFVDGSFSQVDTAQIVVQSGGSLTVYVTGQVRLAGGGFFNHTGADGEGLPERVRFFVADGTGGADPAQVYIDSEQPHFGVFYAPESPVYLESGAEVYGAVIGDTVSTSGSSDLRLHYDEALDDGAWLPADIASSYDDTVPVSTWWAGS